MSIDLEPIHPDLREKWKSFPKLSFNRVTIQLIQWLMKVIPAAKLSDKIASQTLRIPRESSNTPLMIRVHQPKTMQTPTPAILWMHGGGYIVGSPKLQDGYPAKFVEDLGMVVITVDYRLAPNHPFPAALEDCYTALKWIHANAASLNIDSKRIAVGGESAGGGLAASLAQYAQDKGEVEIAFQLLVYPMIDERSALSEPAKHKLMTWTVANNRFGWESYLGKAFGTNNPPAYAVPARRENLAGLPPAWIGVGSLDLFYKEDLAYAERLKQAGVDCELLVAEGAYHGFDVMGDDVPIIQDFRNAQLEALKKALF